MAELQRNAVEFNENNNIFDRLYRFYPKTVEHMTFDSWNYIGATLFSVCWMRGGPEQITQYFQMK